MLQHLEHGATTWQPHNTSRSRITPAEAAKQISELFMFQDIEHADNNHAESAETFLWNFWAFLIQIVQLVPHDHSGQSQLILTLEELSRLPSKTIKIWGVRRCSKFPGFEVY
jgi:hypothetical protein